MFFRQWLSDWCFIFAALLRNRVMGESSDSVSIDIDMIPLGGKVRNLE